MYQFILTLCIIALGLFNGYLYNQMRFLHNDLRKLEVKVERMQALGTSNRVSNEAAKFVESLQVQADNSSGATGDQSSDNLASSPNVETIELVDGFLKGFLDLQQTKLESSGLAVSLNFVSESQVLNDFAKNNSTVVTRLSENSFRIKLGCISNSQQVKTQMFTVNANDSKKLLANDFESLRLFFSPKVGYMNKDCQSPLSSLQILD